MTQHLTIGARVMTPAGIGTLHAMESYTPKYPWRCDPNLDHSVICTVKLDIGKERDREYAGFPFSITPLTV